MVTFEHLSKDARADTPLSGKIAGLPGSTFVHVEARLQDDLGQTWQSHCMFQSSPDGTVDLAGAQPLAAAWSGADAYGLYWSMELGSEEESRLPYFDGATVSLTPLSVELVASVDGKPVAHGQVERHFLHRAVKEEWRDDLIANLFVPVERAVSPGVLVIGGSSGGFAWSNQLAALMATSGRAALAVAYFDWQGAYGLPTSITEIPLELFSHALDRFKQHACVLTDDVAVVGFSKGSEAALLLATKRADVRRVVVYAPSAYVWEAARMDAAAPPRSSWSWNGNPLPFARFTADADFYRTFDKTRLGEFHERALQDTAMMHAARIPVEETDAHILLISGSADSTWPSAAMCETLVRGSTEAGRAAHIRHILFKDAGHYFFLPGMPVNRMDGTPQANAEADQKSWDAVRQHLDLA